MLNSSVPIDVDDRIWARLAPWLAHAAGRQPDPRVQGMIERGRLRLEYERDAEDGELWLALYPVGQDRPVLLLDGRHVGLHLLAGGHLAYVPDPLLDDDLPQEAVRLTD